MTICNRGKSSDSWLTPKERFSTSITMASPIPWTSPHGVSDIGGFVARPQSLTIADLKARERREVDFTLECSGNHGFDFFSSAIGNARWAGTPLAPVLRKRDILRRGSEVVFYGVDGGTLTIRDNGGILSAGQTGKVEPDAKAP